MLIKNVYSILCSGVAANLDYGAVIDELLDSVEDWGSFFAQLGRTDPTLNVTRILGKYKSDAVSRMAVVRSWVKHNPQATWSDVVAILEKSGHAKLAKNLKESYCNVPELRTALPGLIS